MSTKVRPVQLLLPGLFAFAFTVSGVAAVVDDRDAGRPDLLEPAFRLVREAVERDEVPGAIALVARGGKVLRHEAYGLSDIENRLPFTTNTLCWIASITKPVTVAAAMTLVDAGKFALDDPVEKHLTAFREQTDTNGLHHVLTIRQLMSHTSGLVPNPPTRRSGWPIGGPLDDSWLEQRLPEVVQTIARSQLRFKPGSKFEYSNSALFVLGRVIEVVSGKPYAAYVKEKILEPLGMTDTHYAPPTSEAKRVAAIYARRDGKREAIFRFNPAVRIVNAAPDGGLFSYPAQLVPFLGMFLNNDGRVLSRSAVGEMLQEQAHGWGLGWSLQAGLFLHEGSSGTVAWADPKTGVIGILFLQFRDQNRSDERLRKEFRDAVRNAIAVAADGSKAAEAGETLYNGIVLPQEWPPRLPDFPTSVEKDPVIPAYLVSPPAVIPIDVGRQLLVDDFLIAETTLKRTFHLAEYHPASPILKPDRPWEMKNPDHAAAMVFSDGVWYDPKDELFKMWYMVGESAATAYATSGDGIQWEKPSLDVQPETNIVQPGGRDSSTVWLDLEEKDPARRFKMFRVIGAGAADPVTEWNNWVMAIHFSPDGIHWGDPLAKSGRVVDRSTVFWNPFRKVWVYSVRHVYKVGDTVDRSYGFPRKRSYQEGPDVLAAARWEVNEPVRWTDVDRLDPQRDDLKIKPQLYNLDAIAYESMIVGLFTIWRGQPADRHKPNNVVLGYSRDGWHWSRPDRRAFCPVSDKQGDWNANNVQSAGGGFLVVGDNLYFYVSGRTGRPGGNKAGTLTTGLAALRRDGFASMDAEEAVGTLTTRPVRFAGKHLFVNVDDSKGELRVEILNPAGQVVPRFTAENCVPVAADKTLQSVRWRGAEDLSSLANQPVRFRFHLKNGKLYAFWVSPEKSGASQGYVAAGGPGFSSNRDTGASLNRN